MPLRAVRFVAVMLAALTLGMGLCHLMQLPARMGWDQYLWVGSTVQGGLYSLFGSVGAVIDVLTVIALALLTYLVREHRRPGIRLALSAALLFATGLLLWWVLVYPVNVELAQLGQRAGACRLDHLSRALGVGPRDDLAVRAVGLCRADRLGARRHAAQFLILRSGMPASRRHRGLLLRDGAFRACLSMRAQFTYGLGACRRRERLPSPPR